MTSLYDDVVVDAAVTVPPVAGVRAPNASLHVPGSAVAMRKYDVVAAPLGFTEPVSVAAREVTFVTPVDAITGRAGAVVNDAIVPTDVPIALFASAQKKYRVPGCSPVSVVAYATGATPAPSAVPPDAGLRVPNVSPQTAALDVEKRKNPVVDDARGFAVAASVAPVLVIADAAPVVTMAMVVENQRAD
jgi:hypothetical protein